MYELLMFRYSQRLLSILLILIVSACSVNKPIDPEQDSAPLNPIDISGVPDAVPAPVKRTRAGNKSPYTVLGKTYYLLPESKGYRERGIASWYGQKFHGRKTANGETYNMYAMTAAHTTLPIPSYVRVTNLENNRSVIVKINDRGPFHSKRIIDLSYTAASKLGFVNQGTAQVEVVDITPSGPLANGPVVGDTELQLLEEGSAHLQLGAFSEQSSAERLQRKLAALFQTPVRVEAGADQLYRVKMGPLQNLQAVNHIQRILREEGINTGHIVK